MHLIYSLDTGGAEMDLLRKVNALERDFNFVVVTMVRTGKLAAKLKGCSIVNLGLKSPLDIAGIIRFYRVFMQYRPHILHGHLFNAGLMSRLLTIPFGVRRMVTVQMIRPCRPSWQKIADWFLQFVTADILAASKAIRRQLQREGVGKERTSLLYNCVDIEHFRNHRNGAVNIESRNVTMNIESCNGAMNIESRNGADDIRSRYNISEKAVVVGSLCRFDRDKGLDYFVKAAELLKHRKDMVFIIAGYGRERENLQRQIRHAGLKDRFFLHGSVNWPELFLPQLDIFVMPSRTEGLGISLIEAMASGLPVVAAKVGGIPEIVEHGTNGLLFEKGNYRELAHRIVEMADTPELAGDLAAQAQLSVEKFDLPVLADELKKAYYRCLSQKRRIIL